MSSGMSSVEAAMKQGGHSSIGSRLSERTSAIRKRKSNTTPTPMSPINLDKDQYDMEEEEDNFLDLSFDEHFLGGTLDVSFALNVDFSSTSHGVVVYTVQVW